MSHELSLRVEHRAAGRAVHVRADGRLYLSRGCAVLRSDDDGASWTHVTRLPCPAWRGVAGGVRLAARLLRHEVRALLELADGSLIAADRRGVYRAAPGEALMRPSAVESGNQRVSPPMTLSLGPGGRILWGEYNSKTAHGKAVRLFVSDDGGRSFSIARVFEGGSILHVHNLLYDGPRKQYWLFAGDHNHEPGIGALSDDLSRFEWVAKGEQWFRAVEAFDFGDYLLYATDTEREANGLIRFDKGTGRVERLREFEGSCIYACRFGPWYALSTTVEPSAVNAGRDAVLWLSRDGERWREAWRAAKDGWHPVFFQFGSLVLPRGVSQRPVVFFSGQAVRGVDGEAVVGRVVEAC